MKVTIEITNNNGFPCEFEIYANLIPSKRPLIIVDSKRGPSITNTAKRIVEELQNAGYLPPGRRLFYFDSTERLDEIVRNADGSFNGFKAVDQGEFCGACFKEILKVANEFPLCNECDLSEEELNRLVKKWEPEVKKTLERSVRREFIENLYKSSFHH